MKATGLPWGRLVLGALVWCAWCVLLGLLGHYYGPASLPVAFIGGA